MTVLSKCHFVPTGRLSKHVIGKHVCPITGTIMRILKPLPQRYSDQYVNMVQVCSYFAGRNNFGFSLYPVRTFRKL